MGWLYLLGALVFPPVFILWRPRTRVPPARMRLRLAGGVVVVWLLVILWSVRGSISDEQLDETKSMEPTQELSIYSADAPSDSSLILLLGWIPGLVYSGLLMLARKGLERQAPEVLDPTYGGGYPHDPA